MESWGLMWWRQTPYPNAHLFTETCTLFKTSVYLPVSIFGVKACSSLVYNPIFFILIHVFMYGSMNVLGQCLNLGRVCTLYLTQHTLFSELILIIFNSPLEASIFQSFSVCLTLIYHYLVYCPNYAKNVLVKDSVVTSKLWLPCHELSICNLAMYLGVWIWQKRLLFGQQKWANTMWRKDKTNYVHRYSYPWALGMCLHLSCQGSWRNIHETCLKSTVSLTPAPGRSREAQAIPCRLSFSEFQSEVTLENYYDPSATTEWS